MHATVARLRDAVNRHDAHAMAALFAPDYRSEQPLHPNRGFGGRDQVETNWTTMFAGIPDFEAEVRAAGTVDATVWSEWVWRGNRTDGSKLLMAGVMVIGLTDDDLIQWARLYIEPVEEGGADITGVVQEISSGRGVH
ncbi:MAG: nuclear transport factor 2 family protein [Actinomycetes bacterium]